VVRRARGRGRHWAGHAARKVTPSNHYAWCNVSSRNCGSAAVLRCMCVLKEINHVAAWPECVGACASMNKPQYLPQIVCLRCASPQGTHLRDYGSHC
jgi:hypothetical protein